MPGKALLGAQKTLQAIADDERDKPKAVPGGPPIQTRSSDMDVLRKIEQEHMRYDVPHFSAGDTVNVHIRIIEGEKERIQVFKGTVIRVRKGTTNATFTVRKVSSGIGVERVFPLHSPSIDRIEVVGRGKVRQSRIYYLRNLKGKAARIKPRDRKA
jgi:large subunit ribosomal protein L19